MLDGPAAQRNCIVTSASQDLAVMLTSTDPSGNVILVLVSLNSEIELKGFAAALNGTAVIDAKAGMIRGRRTMLVALAPGFRRVDGQAVQPRQSARDALPPQRGRENEA